MKPALILVDGMNIANRSAVAKEILGRMDPEQVEFYQCADVQLPHMYVRMMRDVLDRRKSAVIESSWRDQYVLAALGHPAKMHRAFTRMLDRLAFGCGGVSAYCYADGRTYAKNLPEGNSYQALEPMILKMHDAWEDLSFMGFPMIYINTSDDGFKTDVDAMMERLDIISGYNVGPGIGNWNPGKVVLLVGDRHGPSIQPYRVDMNIAFCDMAKAGSSYWLSEQLEEAGIQEQHLYWINAFDQDGAPTDPTFVGLLQPVAVLTLGDSAARWCDGNQIRCEQFTHPQYHKRFQHNTPYPMIARLKELVKGISGAN